MDAARSTRPRARHSALTGVALEIPQYANPLFGYFSPLQAMPKPQSSPTVIGQQRISLDQAVAAGQSVFPDARLCWIETPHDADGSFRINLRQDGEPNRRFPKTNVWVDQYSGRILAVSNPADLGASDTLINWLHPLHSGEAFGLSGQILVSISGLACPLLFVTGLIRWLQKAGAKRRGRPLSVAERRWL
ncbi:PepSY-associated TM helix domain-containing protein [Methylomonas sp. HYX-M1]|uniref:PepSY-associated TM helix domain-containing protein n=1 Tax=Methylomonas sp. HYX-M1 TaxID=3139307 RepID=UPI00345BEEF2